jgi:hypothetical protein
MWKKLVEIQEGTYEAPKFRAFKGEIEEKRKEEEKKKKEEEEKKAAPTGDNGVGRDQRGSTSSDIDDYYNEVGYYWGVGW